MLSFGDQGYLEYAKTLDDIHKKYLKTIAQIPGLRVLCTSHALQIPIVSDKFNIYAVASLMEDRGWNLLSGQTPPTLILALGERHGDILESFEADIREVLEFLQQNPNYKPHGHAGVYTATANIP